MQTKKVKIVHVVEAFGGGVFGVLVQLLNSLPPDQYDITLVYSIRPETPLDYISYFASHIKMELLPMAREIRPVKDLKALVDLIRTLKRVQPDVVHLHSSKAGMIGRVASRMVSVSKVFYSPHGFSFCRGDVGRLRRVGYRIMERVAVWLGGTIVSVSPSENELASTLTHRTVCISNCIDPNYIRSHKVDVEKGEGKPIVIGTLGRIAPQKNPSLFNEIAKRFTGMTFVWIGDGELRDTLTASNIKVTGFKSRDEAIRELSKVDIYVQTSLWEGMPLAVLEAMALSKPVVATNVAGVRDIIDHQRTGFISHTADDMQHWISLLGNDELLRETIGSNGGKTVDEEYSLDVMVQHYKHIYTLA